MRRVQWRGNNLEDVAALVGDAARLEYGGDLAIETPTGCIRVEVGEWIETDGSEVRLCGRG